MLGGIGPGDPRFVSGLLGLQMFGNTSDPWMEPYTPGVQRDIKVGPRETPHVRWIYQPQSITDRRMGVGFSLREGR